MVTTIAIVINATEAAAAMMKVDGGKKDQSEVELARCECCGMTDEYTAAYIAGVRERHDGRWICGLCAEAVKEECEHQMIGRDEALSRHMKFCEQFRSWSPPTRPAEGLISAMKRVLRRSLDSSPRNNKSPSPTSFLASKAC